MKVLHTSDWHLGASENKFSLKDDQLYFLDQIYRIVEEENVEVVVIAGDVFDRSVASAEAIEIYNDAMTKLCLEMKRQVIIVAGNHDSSERLASCNSLLAKAGLHVLGALEKEPAVVEYDNVDFYLLPWFMEDKVKVLYPEEKENIKSLTDAYNVVCDKCREKFNQGKRNIAVAHAFVSGAELSESESAARLVVGNAIKVNPSVFEGFDYVALGHIHKPQNVTSTVVYSGTPMPFSFGKEEKQEKHVVILDTKDMTRKEIPVPVLHKRTTLSGTWAEISSGAYPDEVKKGYVRIQVEDEYLGIEKLSMLEGIYENILDAYGASLNDDSAEITMTMEEFNALSDNPIEIFKAFYREVYQEEASDHYIELFTESVNEVSETISEKG